jgi:tetratricopeptide (TPR) repeat protein
MSFVASAWPTKLLRQLARTALPVLVLALCASLLTTATAQDNLVQRRAPPAEALEHYTRGREHYQAGRYQDATVELERALTLDPDSPNLVYNLARVYELRGEIDRSMQYYRRYLAMLPASESDERGRVESTIQRLEGARTQPLREPETRTIPVMVPTERGVADTTFWTLASLSLAALVAGSITGGLSLRAERQASELVLGRDGDVAAREARADAADRLALGSDICWAAGAVGGLTSILLYALRSQPVAPSSLAATPAISFLPHGLTLSLRGAL